MKKMREWICKHFGHRRVPVYFSPGSWAPMGMQCERCKTHLLMTQHEKFIHTRPPS